MPRLVPQTPLHSFANAAANAQATKNANIPPNVIQTVRNEPKEPEPKRRRTDSVHSPGPSEGLLTSSTRTTLKLSPSNNTKTVNQITLVKSPTGMLSSRTPISSIGVSSTGSSGPRVIFVSSHSPGTLGTLPAFSSIGTIVTPVSTFSNSAINNQLGSKISSSQTLPLTASSELARHLKAATGNKTLTSISIPNVTNVPQNFTSKIYTTKSNPQQVVVFPANSQQKTITIPVSQALKSIQSAQSGNSSTVVYPSSSLKGVQGTITIQTFKSGANKVTPPNLIIMPATKNSGSGMTKPVTTNIATLKTSVTNVKSLQAQIIETAHDLKGKSISKQEIRGSAIKPIEKLNRSSAEILLKKELPQHSKEAIAEKAVLKSKILTSTTHTKNLNSGNIIEIQASDEMFQNLMSGQLSQDIMDLVQKAVNIASTNNQESSSQESGSSSQSQIPQKSVNPL